MNIQLLCSHSIRLKVETAVLDEAEIYYLKIVSARFC